MRVERWLAGLVFLLSPLVAEARGVRFHPGQGKQAATKAATAPGVLALRQALCPAGQPARAGRRERFLAGREAGRPMGDGRAGAAEAGCRWVCWRQPSLPPPVTAPLASAAPGAVRRFLVC